MTSAASSSDQLALSRVIIRDVLIAAVLGLVAIGVTWFSALGQHRFWTLTLLALVLLAVRVILRARVSVRYWPVELCAISLSLGYWGGFYVPTCVRLLLSEKHYLRLDGYIALLLIATAVVLCVLGFLVWRVEDRIRKNQRNRVIIDPL